VFGWLEEKDARQGPDGEVTYKTHACLRGKVRDIVEEAKKDGVEFLLGFESEFYLLESTDPVRVNSQHQYSEAKGLLTSLRETKALEEIVDALIDSGIKVETWHPETGHGQYEIVTSPLDPLGAADALVHTRQTIINIAAQHGLRATFVPRVTVGTAAHLHISAHRTGEQKPRESLSEVEKSFLAGILEDTAALAAITLPIPASYERVVDGALTCGSYVAWGTENRECPIRLSNATSPSSRNFEMRFVDGTANPYLVVAAFVGLGYGGIKSNKELRMPNFTGRSGPAQLTEEERRARGITQRMPLSWEESREVLKNNKALREILDSNFVDKYLAANKVLAENLAIYGDDKEKTLTRLVELF
jgi:glutamine synthetase